MKRISGLIIAVVMILQTMAFVLPVSAETSAYMNQSRELMTSGNKIVYKDDPETVIRLTGMNIPGGEWTGTPGVEKLDRSAREAMYRWNANLIRLPVSVEGWYGTYSYVNDGGRGYRNYIDEIIQMVASEGRYVVLDLHHYTSFNNSKYLDFWREAAVKYGNNPAVLFGILNEPHGTSWEVWRNGDGNKVTGHQQIVEMIRDLGAKNIIVAGGLDYAYKIDECLEKGLLLVDQGSNGDKSKTGNGIMYDTHIYPWKGHASSWDSAVGDVRKQYPILVGESGWDPATNESVGGKDYPPGSDMYHDKWMPELFAWMNDEATYGNLANWTGWCFHPSSAPRILENKDQYGNAFKDDNYEYTPTDFCGVYVRDELKNNVGTNIASFAKVTAEGDGGSVGEYLVDGDENTVWTNSGSGEKEILLDFEGIATINRWRVKSLEITGGSKAENVNSFRIETSINGRNWSVIDTVSDNWGAYLERQVHPTRARYVRFVITQGNLNGDAVSICDIDLFSDQEIQSGGSYEAFTDGSGRVSEHLETFVSQDFEGATAEPGVIHAVNKANGQDLPWIISGKGTYEVSSGDQENESSYILGRGDDTTRISLTLPEEIRDQDALVVFDTRIKRTALSGGNVSLILKDANNRELYELAYPTESIPILTGSRVYGYETQNPAETEIAYPYTDGWVYLRTIINQQMNRFEMYFGENLFYMEPITGASASFGYKTSSASGIGKIEIGISGGLCIDDLEIYTADTKAMSEDDYIIGNIGSGIATKLFALQDFEETSVTGGTVPQINVYDKAAETMMPWKHKENSIGSPQYYSIKTDEENAYLGGVRKGQAPVYMQLLSPADDGGNLLYFDVKIKRESLTDDDVSLILKDDSGREIVELRYPGSSIPQVYADKTYGTQTSSPEDTSISYPFSDSWLYLRIMMDFSRKELQIYQGADENQLVPIDKTARVMGFKDQDAINLKEVYIGDRGALNIDNLKIRAGIPYNEENGATMRILDVSYGEAASANIQFVKEAEESLDGTLYIAVYHGQKMEYATKEDIHIDSGEVLHERRFALGNIPEGSYTVKAFLWNEEMQPLTEAAVY